MIKKYEFWWAYVKYEDCEEIERRPVLVIDQNAFIVAYKVTSKDRGDSGTELRLQYWQEAGLTQESSIRLSKVLKLVEKDMIAKIGDLDPRDRMRLELRLIRK